MEVHAHTHTQRKKLTHYIWEFFMLFLAVFCGFLAENEREHYVEHQREKQYIRSLINDLSKDTTKIQAMTLMGEEAMKGLDSLVHAFDTLSAEDNDQLKKLYSLFYTWGTTPFVVTFTDRTIAQLKSAGGMRLIRNQKVSDKVTTYYEAANLCKEQVSVYFTDMNTLIGLSYKILDMLYNETSHANMKLARKLIADNPQDVREFINRTQDLKDVIGNYHELLFQMEAFAKQVINTIKTEYHLK